MAEIRMRRTHCPMGLCREVCIESNRLLARSDASSSIPQGHMLPQTYCHSMGCQT